LYQYDPEITPSRSEQADAAVLADLAVTAIVADLDGAGDVTDPPSGDHRFHLVAIATRSLMINLKIDRDRAIERIRLHALLNGQTMDETAQDVLRRTIRLDQLGKRVL
jgi:hypothetical protein